MIIAQVPASYQSGFCKIIPVTCSEFDKGNYSVNNNNASIFMCIQ